MFFKNLVSKFSSKPEKSQKALIIQEKLNAMPYQQARIESLKYVSGFNVIFCAKKGISVYERQDYVEKKESFLDKIKGGVKSAIDTVLMPLDVTVSAAFKAYDFCKNTEIVFKDKRENSNSVVEVPFYHQVERSPYPQTLQMFSFEPEILSS